MMKMYFILILLSAVSVPSAFSAVQTTCPYVGGSAVYKARTINYYLEPGAMYDDMKACNAVGVYKQGNNHSSGENVISKITIENEALAQIRPSIETLRLRANGLLIYPNPSNEIFNIKYNELIDFEINIYDITGRLIKSIYLPKGEQNATISLEEFASGIYTYKQFVNGKINSTGKLIKE